jgi:putative DNA primase/helicase
VPTDYVDQVAGSIVEQLKAGIAPWVKPWQPGERFMPYNPTTGNEYHGMNAMWLMSRAESHGYGDTRWMTYRQAQEAGGHVRKGEKGTPIQYWKWQGLEPVRDAAGKLTHDAEGNPVRRMVRYERPRVWSAAVFNAAQIDGLPPAPPRPILAEWDRHERCETILARSGVSIRHVPGDRAFYRLPEDTITLPERGQFASGDRYYATALHEIGHATGHPSRLNRQDLGDPFGSEPYAREELRAEIASLMLGEQLGIGHDPGQHVAYVASWIKALQQDPREIFRAAADAEKIAKLVRSFELEQVQQADEAHDLGERDDRAGQAVATETTVRPPVMIQENHPAMTAADDRTYLAVPYAEKDDAKALGAKWDRQAKAWYVPAGMELEAFQPWLPAMGQVHIAVESDPRVEFAQALRECGLRIDGLPEMDGQMHRAPVEGDRGSARSGSYVGYLDGRPAGHIQNFRTGLKMDWKSSGQVTALDAHERAQMAAEAAQKRLERVAERERQYERTSQEVEVIWTAATPVETHPYLADKGVPSHGLRQAEDGRLLVPVQDINGKLWTLQHISGDKFKQFHEGGRVEGGHYPIGVVENPGPLLVAEGYATAATVHALTDLPTIVAFNAGNLSAVAQAYRTRYPDRPIYVAGDNDHRREADGKPNVGRDKAEQAAASVNGFTLLPTFLQHDAGSDWNDLALGAGHAIARRQILTAIAIAEREQMVQSRGPDRDPDNDRSQTHGIARDQLTHPAGADLER